MIHPLPGLALTFAQAQADGHPCPFKGIGGTPMGKKL